MVEDGDGGGGERNRPGHTPNSFLHIESDKQKGGKGMPRLSSRVEMGGGIKTPYHHRHRDPLRFVKDWAGEDSPAPKAREGRKGEESQGGLMLDRREGQALGG